MTKKQLLGLVDCLANVCTFNTSKDYSLSIEETSFEDYYSGKLLVFLNDSHAAFCTSDVRQLLGIAEAWNVSLYFETVNGVTVAKYL